MASCTIAVNRRKKEDGADFIPIVVWGSQAEVFARYLGKGKEVALTGRMQVRDYTDKNDNKRYITEVVVESFDFCGPSGNNGSGGSSSGGGTPFGNSYGSPVPEEEIPF